MPPTLATGQVALGGTAKKVLDGSPQRSVAFVVTGGTGFIGGPNVTSSNGYQIPSTGSPPIPCDADVWAAGSGTLSWIDTSPVPTA
jgi:hypothetical protein